MLSQQATIVPVYRKNGKECQTELTWDSTHCSHSLAKGFGKGILGCRNAPLYFSQTCTFFIDIHSSMENIQVSSREDLLYEIFWTSGSYPGPRKMKFVHCSLFHHPDCTHSGPTFWPHMTKRLSTQRMCVNSCGMLLLAPLQQWDWHERPKWVWLCSKYPSHAR